MNNENENQTVTTTENAEVATSDEGKPEEASTQTGEGSASPAEDTPESPAATPADADTTALPEGVVRPKLEETGRAEAAGGASSVEVDEAETKGVPASVLAEIAKLPEWKCHKVVRADKIIDILARPPFRDMVILTENGATFTVDISWYSSKNPVIGGYLVVYNNGEYLSASPEKPFVSGYTRA